MILRLAISLLLTLPAWAWGQSTKLQIKIKDAGPEQVVLYSPIIQNLGSIPREDDGKGGRLSYVREFGYPVVMNWEAFGVNYPILMVPGQDLDADFEAKALTFQGSGAPEAQIFYEYRSKFQPFTAEAEQASPPLEESVDLLELDLFSARKMQRQWLDNHSQKGMMTGDGLRFVRNWIEYRYLEQLVEFPFRRQKIKREGRIYPLPGIMVSEMERTLELKLPYLSIEPAARFFYRFAQYQAEAQHDFKLWDNPDQGVSAHGEQIMGLFEGEWRIHLLGMLLLERCGEMRESTFRRFVQEAQRAGADEQFEEWIGLQCQDQIGGAVAHNHQAEQQESYVLYDMDGQKVAFEDFKGKVIYVDFWASWCGPCRAQFPYAAQLKEKFTKKQSKDIVFLYINIDDTEKKWMEAVEKLELEGEHVQAPGAWGSRAVEYFRVTGIPRYLLIDREGNIVNSNAPRPSDDRLYEDILRLL